MVEAAKERGIAIDCIILDYHMPEMNGGEVVAQLRSAGLCDDPGDFDVANMGDYYVAACGSPVPYLIAAQPWDGRVSAEWCRSSESPLAGKTVMVVQGADWTLIHPLASMGEMEAITDAIGGTAIPRSKACRT